MTADTIDFADEKAKRANSTEDKKMNTIGKFWNNLGTKTKIATGMVGAAVVAGVGYAVVRAMRSSDNPVVAAAGEVAAEVAAEVAEITTDVAVDAADTAATAATEVAAALFRR